MDTESEETSEVTRVEFRLMFDRILDHHKAFGERLETLDEKVSSIVERVHGESLSRMHSLDDIKKELHGRVNSILVSITGGAALFILGVIMFLLEKK